MKAILGAASTALLAFALTGCGGGTSVAPPPSLSESSAQSNSPTPTPTPTPSAMTTEAAAHFYLTEVCKMNASTAALNKVVLVVPLDLAQAIQKSSEKRDSTRAVIQSFSSQAVLWPADVKQDIATLNDALYGSVAESESLSNQRTETGFWAVWNAAGPASKDPMSTAAQKVRLKLGLPADTFGSCGMAAQ